jgi:hypothetical protein
VEVHAPQGLSLRFTLSADETALVRIDGRAAIGVDAHGPGHWPDGETWQRLPVGGAVIERYVWVRGMSHAQYRGLSVALGLPEGWLGRWKGMPGARLDIILSNQQYSCTSDAGLDAAIDYIRGHGLVYEETRTVRYQL